MLTRTAATPRVKEHVSRALRIGWRASKWLARMVMLLAGLWVIYHYSQEALGGREKLWAFSKSDEHRFTAMSLLTGTFRLRAGLSKLGHDEQVFNGAVYTNWGFGVPLLQIPFDLAATKMKSLPQKFFPDRLIYFSYFMAMVPLLWKAFDRLLATRETLGASRLRRHIVSFGATGFVLTMLLYPLMSYRFLIYEETIAYFVVAQLVALSAYVFATRSWSTWALVGLGLAAGAGLMIRPTGLVYLGCFGLLLLCERRRLKALLAFAIPVLPLLGFWAYSNAMRTGSVMGIGLNNSMPWRDPHTPMFRFGTGCSDTLAHTAQVAGRMFNVLFWAEDPDAKHWPWLEQCHLQFEDRAPPGGGFTRWPYLGPWVLAAILWMVADHVRRRDWRPAFFVPLLGMVLLAIPYVLAGSGFVWRYTSDFTPLLILLVIQYVRFLPRAGVRTLGLPLAAALVLASFSEFEMWIRPDAATLEVLAQPQVDTMWDDFTNSRYVQDKDLPAHVKCGEVQSWPFHNGQGWHPDCSVDTFTNLFLGVPWKKQDEYSIAFKVEGIEAASLRVYVNGRIYTARRMGDSYEVDMKLHYDSLSSPIVMATIEWTREPTPPAGVKMLSVLMT